MTGISYHGNAVPGANSPIPIMKRFTIIDGFLATGGLETSMLILALFGLFIGALCWIRRRLLAT